MGFVFIGKRQNNNQNTPVPSGQIPILPTAGVISFPKSVTYTFTVDEQQFPLALPVFSTTQKDNMSLAQLVAYRLGLMSDPTENSQTGGTQWVDGVQSLTYYPKHSRLTYYSDKNSNLPPTTKEEVVATANSFFTSVVNSSTGVSVQPSDVTFVAIKGTSYSTVSAPSEANMATVSLTYYIHNAPVYSDRGHPLSSGFKIHANKLIRSAAIIFPPNVVSSKDKPTIPIQTAREILSKNNARFLWITPQNPTDASMFDVSFSDVNITTESLGYMYTNNTLLPVYVFKGSVIQGNEKTRGATVRFAVPAVYE